MKILVVQDHLRSGGTERTAIKLTRAFRGAGHEARLVTFRPGGALRDTAADVAPQALQSRDPGLDWYAPGLRRVIREYAPDIVLPMGRMANCWAGLLAPKQPRSTAPVWIATARGNTTMPWLYRRALRRCAHVVTNSRALAEELTTKHLVEDARTTVIRNGLVFPALAPDVRERLREETRARHGAGPGTRVLLCVAAFRLEKDHAALLAAVAILPEEADWQLWLAGDGPTRTENEGWVAARPVLAARVKFLGFQADPTPLYAGADLAVLTSAVESLSNFLIEAQAHGLPAVVRDVTGMSECLAPESLNRIVPVPRGAQSYEVLDPAYAKALAEAVSLGPAPQVARQRIASWARDAFDPKRERDAYLGLFERVLSAARGTAGDP